jgi:flavin reductase (DIM6/NTAB) family NADH-FMN oxidoreductase RutF
MGIYNPRQTIVVTCRSKGFDNGCTLSWHSPASFEPFLYSIFLYKKRKSFEMIKESRVFCVNFLTEDQEKLAMLFGTKSGYKIDKFKEGNVEKEDCEKIDCPRIKGCSAYLECGLSDMFEVGDHIALIGKVIKEVKGNMKKKLFQSNITGTYSFTTTKD